MQLLWNIPLLLVGSYIALNLYLFYQRRKFRHMNSVHVPVSLRWFLGIVPDMNRRLEARPLSNVVDLFVEYHKETGWDVFVMPIFIRNIIFCIDLGMIAPILTDSKTFPKNRDVHKLFAEVAGVRLFGDYGLLNDPGTEVWHAKRRIMDPAFHRSFLRTIMFGMNKVGDNLIDVLERKEEDHVFDIAYDLNKSAFEAIAICGFDWSDEQVEMEGDNQVQMAGVVIKDMATVFKERFLYNLPWRHRKQKATFRKIVTYSRDIIRNHIRERLEKGGPPKDDILSYIIKGNSCSDQLTIENTVDEYLTFLGAGMETTAITMAITVFYLMINQEIYQKAQKEVDEVFGDEEELSFEDTNKLVYLEMVIKECLRLKPPVASTGRECKEDNIVIKGVRIPKDAFILIPQRVLQNDSRYWNDPEVFDPERFAPKATNKIKAFTYMPFMAGPRSCIGKNFALLEAKVILSKILHRFEFINPNPELKELITIGNLTTRPLNGVEVKIRQRVRFN